MPPIRPSNFTNPIGWSSRFQNLLLVIACQMGVLLGEQPASAPRAIPTPAPPVRPSRPPIDLSKPAPRPADSSFGKPGANGVPFKAVGPGLFQIGNLTIDKEHRTVSFPAVVNMNQGPMEYFLVSNYGKVHESILKTEVTPEHLHIAMLLLDVKVAETAANAKKPPGGTNIEKPGSEILPGAKIRIDVSWTAGGKEVRHTAEELVENLETKAVLEKGKWVYNGSMMIEGYFQAQVTGSLVSLITDPVALANNIAKGHDNDDNWMANTAFLPAMNTPVQVTMRVDDGKNHN
jgi:hypothetical protein